MRGGRVTGVVCGLLLTQAGAGFGQTERQLTAEEALRRYPKVETNASARRLEELVAAFGADLAPVPPSDDDASAPSNDAPAVVRSAMREYFRQERDSVRGEAGEIPQAVVELLDRRAAELDAVVEHLVSAEPPRWGYDLAALPNFDVDPGPVLWSRRDLEALLLTRALRDGGGEASARALEASWRLHDPPQERPDIAWQSSSAAAARLRLAVLRKLGRVPVGWAERLATPTSLDQVLNASDVERAMYPVWMDRVLTGPPEALASAPGEESWLERAIGAKLTQRLVFNPLTRYYLRQCMEEASDRWWRLSRGYRRLDPCVIAAGRVPDAAMQTYESIPWWNPLGAIMVPSYDNLIRRSARVVVEADLTRRVLELREARAKAGAWPETLASDAIAMCPGRRWRYERSTEGGIALCLDPPLGLPEDIVRNGDPPLEFRAGP